MLTKHWLTQILFCPGRFPVPYPFINPSSSSLHLELCVCLCPVSRDRHPRVQVQGPAWTLMSAPSLRQSSLPLRSPACSPAGHFASASFSAVSIHNPPTQVKGAVPSRAPTTITWPPHSPDWGHRAVHKHELDEYLKGSSK